MPYRWAVRFGVISDIHGVAPALRVVLDDAHGVGVDRWLVLGDLVLFGPEPVEVVELLAGLPDATFIRGNTDRYVLTDEQPHPHSSPADAAGSADLVRRYGLMAAGAAWTRGALDQAGALGFLDALVGDARMTLSDGTRLLAVHASPASDDGPGIDARSSADTLAQLLVGAEADLVVGGHTHEPTDRRIGALRALNPGSVGLPRTLGRASWMLIDSSPAAVSVEHRTVPFDADGVIDAVHRRRHPNREFITSVLTRGTFLESDLTKVGSRSSTC